MFVILKQPYIWYIINSSLVRTGWSFQATWLPAVFEKLPTLPSSMPLLETHVWKDIPDMNITSASRKLLQNNPRKPKVSIQIIKNAKRNRYKRTNEHWYSRPLIPSLKGTETKYEMETKHLLIDKERKQI